MKIIDSNVLIYAVDRVAPQHASCRRWLEQALNRREELGFNWIAISGFLRVTTHTRILTHPLSVQEALDHVDRWLAVPIVQIVEPLGDYWDVVKELLSIAGRGGNLVTDAHLAALALAHNATLVSCDGDFGQFPRLKWENPLSGK